MSELRLISVEKEVNPNCYVHGFDGLITEMISDQSVVG